MARALSHNSHTKNRSLDMSDSSKAQGPIRVSEIFNSPDADVVVRSADNIAFLLHKKNLECSTGSSPPADTPVDPNETVHLTESGETLEILFHAIYPRPFPEERMKELKFKPFMLLAEAAEKYAVYSMISVCKLYMREVLYPTTTEFYTAARRKNTLSQNGYAFWSLLSTTTIETSYMSCSYSWLMSLSRN